MSEPKSGKDGILEKVKKALGMTDVLITLFIVLATSYL